MPAQDPHRPRSAGAAEYVKRTISDLLMNRMDLSLLVVTKGLTQEADKYDNKAAHVELAKRAERDPATAPVVGDRLPRHRQAAKNAKGFEKSEDPIYALENNLPIDYQHYLDHYLDKPLCRIFDPIMKDAKSKLLKGDHTLSIAQPGRAARPGDHAVRQGAPLLRGLPRVHHGREAVAVAVHALPAAKEPEHLQKALDAVERPRARLQQALDAVPALPGQPAPGRPSARRVTAPSSTGGRRCRRTCSRRRPR